ncbi:MAG: B12-binding domain-containing radical SAM protein, partial [Candidatus Aminicenantes bacterium]|nr:B12-binding domain-containing radical SAM protein [Candidatus Aminicenantes bacterium]
MSKIVFIEPKAPNLHIFSRFPLPRLGPIILGTMMKQRGWEVEIFVEEMREIDFGIIESVDLVGISTITSTAPRAYAIADRVREKGVPVVMGGPHVTFMADEALEHADFVIRGEGEQTLMAFIEAWEKGGGFSDIPNLSYRENEQIIHNPLRPFIKDLDQIPFPDLSLLKSTKKGISGLSSIPVQTSRGCPFDCSFCSVTGMFGKKYRFRSTENIIEELRHYNERKNLIFFYDDNFTADRKRAKNLLEAMIRENFKFKWTTQVRADVAKDLELVRLMKKSGCHTLYIGFESVNPESLKAMKKRQTVEEIAEAIKILRRHRIGIHGMFVYGFDEDDWKTVKQTVKFAKKSKLNSTQFLILTPLPGSEFFDKVRCENRIQFQDWALYDAHHVVFRPARLSLFDLQRAQIFSHKKFYSLKETAKRMLKGKWFDVAIAAYARNLNRVWQKKN